jgi:F-box protein 11
VTGIEILSSDPMVIMNKIKMSFDNGISTIAKNGLRCSPDLMYNEIFRNKENGLQCSGENNHTKVYKNNMITSNRRCGIKIMEGAHV